MTKTSDWSRHALPLLNGAYASPNNQAGKVFFTLGGTNGWGDNTHLSLVVLEATSKLVDCCADP